MSQQSSTLPKVLVIEDEVDLHDYYVFGLRGKYDCRFAINAAEIEEKIADVSMVISDYYLEGTEFHNVLKMAASRPLLLVSGCVETVLDWQLTKPVELKVLVENLAALEKTAREATTLAPAVLKAGDLVRVKSNLDPYLVKENEGHGFRNEENRFEFYEMMAKFLEMHLNKQSL